MKKLFTLILIVISIIVLVACGQQNNEPINEATTESTETSAQTDSGEQWPTEYMSVLPKPKAKISFIEKLDGTEEIPEGDTETKPSSVNVDFDNMSKKEANDYYQKLKNSGFTIHSDENTDEKILLVGALNDTDNNPFVFSYIPDEKYGNVSITILKELNE